MAASLYHPPAMPSERVQRQIDRLLDEMEQAASDGAWDAARARATDVLAMDSENEDAKAFLAVAERRLGESSGDRASRPSPPPPEPATPSSFAGGRYEVRGFLGEGGKKRVFLAHDTLLDRDVAFALVRTEGLDDAGRQRVQREAQAMGRLGDHPNIVPVLDLGQEDGQPYLVSQYMAGGDVEELLRADEGVPLERTLEIARAVCEGLAFAHQHNVIHRDLKPGNVWLTDDGTAKIGDFGLAVSLDRSRITQAGTMVGTANYMPPEQALGGEVTGRSDLYSLGAMLYELVTGRPPFVGDDATAVISQHINTPPVAPTWHNSECPSALEALILRLLEKDPSQRPGSAEEVVRALESIDLSQPAVTEPGVEQAAASAANPLYRTTFVGREGELKQLQGAFDAAMSGQGGLMMVVGEPGIGKTTLTEQLGTYAMLRGGMSLVGHCYEEGSLSLPYLAFVEAMRSYVLDRDHEALRSELGAGAGDVARIVSEIRERLDVELPEPSTPEEDRFRLMQAVTTFLRNAADVQPIAIVLEDLHDADKGTLDLLNHLARSLSGSRLLVVGTYRDVEVDRAHPLSGALAELRRTASFERVTLRGLSPNEVQRMLSNLADQEVPFALAEAVFRQTEGNPLFVQEVIRFLAEEGLIARDGGQSQATGDQPLAMQIPEGLRDVIGKRMSRLGDACNQLLAVAAVIGREFEMQTLEAVADVSEDDLASALEEAVGAAVIEERSRAGVVGAVRYRFTHAFFRQTLYEELIAPRRIRLHQQVARALETQYASRLDERAAELAEHFSYSSDAADLAKAVEYCQRAAERAAAVYDYGETARLLDRALGVQDVLDPDDTERRCDLLLALADALLSSDEPSRAESEVAEEAFALAEGLGDADRAAHACIAGLDGLASVNAAPALQGPRGQEWAERLHQHARDDTIGHVWADIVRGAIEGRGAELWPQALKTARRLDDPDAFHFAAGLVLFSGANWDSVGQHVAEEVAQRAGDPARVRWIAFSQYCLGIARLRFGDREAAERVFSRVIDLPAKAPESAVVGCALAAQAILAAMDGRLEEAVEIAQRLPGETGGLIVRTIVTHPLFWLGRVDDYFAMRPTSGVWEAHTFALAGRADEARAVLAAFNPRATENHSVVVMVMQGARLLGDNERVRALAERAIELWDPVATVWMTITDRHLGDAHAFLGDPEQARRRYDSAIEVAERMRWRPEIALTRLSLAELLFEHYPDQRDQAAEHLDFATGEFREMKMQPYLEQALRVKLELQGAGSSDAATSIEAVAVSVGVERPDFAPHVAPDGTVTILFSDIEGSTTLNTSLGDRRWMELLREHQAIVRREIGARGGFEVKTEGDGFMLAFGSARDALHCAIAMQRAFTERNDGLDDDGTPINVRIGLHTGEPVAQGDDFYGVHVVMASRIASQAAGGEVLVSSLLRELVASSGEFALEARAPVALKGLDGEHVTYAVGWR